MELGHRPGHSQLDRRHKVRVFTGIIYDDELNILHPGVTCTQLQQTSLTQMKRQTSSLDLVCIKLARMALPSAVHGLSSCTATVATARPKCPGQRRADFGAGLT